MDSAISKLNRERIREKVESGLYSSADDVISAALGLLERLDPEVEREWADMRESVRQGLKESKDGLGISGEEVFAELRRRNAEFVRKKQNGDMKQ